MVSIQVLTIAGKPISRRNLQIPLVAQPPKAALECGMAQVLVGLSALRFVLIMRHYCRGAADLEVGVLEPPGRLVGSTHEGIHLLVPVIANALPPDIFTQRGIQQLHK
jgi:hypothetical protein